MNQQKGKVYLVGAGPGDVAYLTVRAQELLGIGEVLVYDALVDPKVLQLVPLNCQLFDVGKRGGEPSTKQAEINRMLVEQCQQGKQVIRLKSGDPFIFGRSTSEIQALIAARCEVEVVPGISAALAAPLLAGIPLTDPVLSRCFAVLSAHEPDELDWQSLACMETLVILMGGRNLDKIVDRVQKYGRSPKTPIAVIRWAGHPQQKIWTGELENIVELTSNIPLSPAVIVIGEVVGLRPYLQIGDTDSKLVFNDESKYIYYPRSQLSFAVTDTQQHPLSTQHLPLAGKTVLVTRSAGQSGQFSELLQQVGATVMEMPALEIGPPCSWEALDNAIVNIHSFHWLILTSTNGVDYFFERLQAVGKDSRVLAGIKIAVVGKKTAERLQQQCLQPDFIPPDFVADSLVENFPESLAGKKILFPRVETGGREVLVQELSAKGAIVVEVPAYQSQCPQTIAPFILNAIENKTIDIITFASSKTVQCFHQLVKNSLSVNALGRVSIASIGPQTSKTCKQLLGRVDVEAKEYTLEGLVQSLIAMQG